MGGLKTAPALVVTSPPVRVISDTLRRDETVSQLFLRRGVNDVDWSAIAKAVRAFEPSRLRAGLVFQFRQRHGEDAPRAVAVRVAYDTRLVMERSGAEGGWAASVEHIAWRAESFVLQGTVRTSISDAITGAMDNSVMPTESRAQLVWSLADVYDWVVDFSRDVMRGDRFQVLAEREVSSEGEVRWGRILAARLDLGTKPLYAFRFDDADGHDAFYDEQAKSMRRELLRAPLEYRRIGSGFSRSRYHPILHYYRPHLGIDFGAAYGTPVRSVGKGTVTFAGRDGGYGNMVEIRHNARTTTRYAHLSAYGSGIHVGAHVEQGQTIGYVGASGLATSPHLHYELRLGGVAVNPRRQFSAGEGAPIASGRRAAFEEERRRLLVQLEPTPVAAAPVRSTDD
jgi:murein DD-endopeptidase MepM/ murein hydrolase activator NlpD